MDKLIIEFNKKFDKQKQELIDGFKALGEEKRLPKALATIEGEQPTYKDYFKAGWQSRQAEVDQLKNQLIKAGFTDRGGQLLVPPQGKPPRFDLLDVKQAEINQLQSQINEMAEVGLSQESVIKEKDKKLKAVEQILIELKESMTNFKEMDLYDKGVRVVTDCIIRDLEKAMRGEHE